MNINIRRKGMKNYNMLAKAIVFNVGGRKNITNLTHCITRLRFIIKDESKINKEELENIDGVLAVVMSAGQTQVVIGSEVDDVYQAVVQVAKLDQSEESAPDNSPKQKSNLLDKFIDLVSGIFQPLIRPLTASGITLGFLAIISYLGWLPKSTGTYQILYAAGQSMLYFLPLMVGASAAKKFNFNIYMGILISAALLFPNMIAAMGGTPLYTIFAGTLFESKIFLEFLGIPVILMKYQSSVIPAIFAVYFASRIGKFFNEHMNKNIKDIFGPMLTLMISVSFTYLVIGPIATFLSNILSFIGNGIYTTFPVIAGLVMGFFWQILVMMGLHWGFVPLFINEIATTGSSGLNALVSTNQLAMFGVCLAIFIKTKKKSVKDIALPSMISALCGITEPAIYGLALPRKKPLIAACIGASVGGAIVGLVGARIHYAGGNGIFKIAAVLNPETGVDPAFLGYLVADALAMSVGFLATWFFAFSDAEDEKNGLVAKTVKVSSTSNETIAPVVEAQVTQSVGKEGDIFSPMNGEVIDLSEVPDPVFSGGTMGSGVAINPSEGKLYSPCDGVLDAAFYTGHAFSIISDEGIELLIHLGINTVNLKGKYFSVKMEEGAKLKKGDLIATFDIESIKKEGYSMISPVIITDPDSVDVSSTDKKVVAPQGYLFSFKSK
jgi:PTS system beta-glucosides-specific IIC component